MNKLTKKQIKNKRRVGNIKYRPIYSTSDLDDFINKTYKSRMYFFRNVYMIEEHMPELGITSRYLEVRTMRKVYRCYIQL